MPATKVLIGVVAIGAAALGISEYARQRGGPGEAPAPELANRLGYLTSADLSDGVNILPPPPAAGSPAMQADEQARQAALKLQGTDLYTLAKADAVREAPNTIQDFVCALGTDISKEHTPVLYQLLGRVRLDVRAASYPVKTHYLRPRPFVAHGTHSCYVEDEGMVHEDGSYPSARGAVGWAYALVLSQVYPQRRDALVSRGVQFSQNRVVCDQEWQSDVDAGRKLAEVVVSRLQKNASYRADIVRAREEVAAQVADGVKPDKPCGLEQAALASR